METIPSCPCMLSWPGAVLNSGATLLHPATSVLYLRVLLALFLSVESERRWRVLIFYTLFNDTVSNTEIYLLLQHTRTDNNALLYLHSEEKIGNRKRKEKWPTSLLRTASFAERIKLIRCLTYLRTLDTIRPQVEEYVEVVVWCVVQQPSIGPWAPFL
jgi:hypothetical protein